MNKNIRQLLFLIVAFASASCSPTQNIPATFAPTQTQASTPTAAPTFTPTFAPTFTPAVTSTPLPPPLEYTPQFLSALPRSEVSCLPDKTADDVGVYIYDLSQNRELVSINADVPFQFASAFKAPLLTYFLTQCKPYWDVSSPEWNAYFESEETARGIPYYVSPEYRALVAAHVGDVRNWDNIEAFFDANRVINSGGQTGAIDRRYFILSKAYSMTARSNNYATGEILQFVYDFCPAENSARELSCGAPNAIHRFNQWFDEFSQVAYAADEARRGLFEWDVILEKDARGNSYEAKMVTAGQKDLCALQTARLNCSDAAGASVWTARDLFQFYESLYRLEDESVRRAALDLLALDVPGPSRGNLKNLARKMGAVSMSKNGHAHFIHGSINTDAGIFQYRNTPFVVIVMGYDAQPSLSMLYGDYNAKGEPLTPFSLIQNLLDDYLSISQ